jgi:hypothetical protein
MQSPNQGPNATDAAMISQEQIVSGDAENGMHGSVDPDAGVLEEFDLDDIEIIESKVFG